MAHMWIADDGAGWRDALLAGEGVAVEGGELVPAPRGFVSVPAMWRVGGDDRPERWVLVVPQTAAVRVNGEHVMAGIRVLENRDLIQIGDGPPLFYSTDSNACIAPLPDLGRKVICPRCKKEIAPGKPAVRCPGCGTFHHQDEEDERCCWTFSEQCSGCDRSTDLTADARWSPEHL